MIPQDEGSVGDGGAKKMLFRAPKDPCAFVVWGDLYDFLPRDSSSYYHHHI